MWRQVSCSQLIARHVSTRTRNNGVKLSCKQVQLDNTKFFFTNDVVRAWDKLSPSVVQCDTINSFKNKLHHHLLQQGLRIKQLFGVTMKRNVSIGAITA